MGGERQSIERNVNFILEFFLPPTSLPHPLCYAIFPADRSALYSDLSMPSHFARWKAWLQLVLRVSQYKGASDSKMKNLPILSKMLQLAPTMMVSTVLIPHRPPTGC
jgi:hypothetical protein